MVKEVPIHTPYITLGQMLKLADVVSSGVEAKMYLQESEVLVNGVSDNRRGRKLYPGDEVETGGATYRICSSTI
ncbi:MAG: S4 domain-containing protein YaaA [Firmicutes bacterium]|uniref:S4 domain-containing protein YaaA n=1 Tax=Candidatus Scatoplasma merdavium TaxID=2840932 RepID=A0A9D9GS76_9BACL|nr:S4 domain-containing protein YaaA [Candidatus Scatoplasma merdavium]